MKHTVAAYKDIDTNKFNTPFYVPFSVDDLCEQVMDGVKKGKIEGAKGLELYHLGSYDTATGQFDLLAKPMILLVLGDYVRE